MTERQVHDSVRHLDNALEVYLCKKCPSYHCPLCPTEKVQFKAAHEAVGHLQHHLTWTVVHGCFKVYKCHLSCHDKPHYHCHSCHKFIVRRCDYTTHIKRHPCPTGQHPSTPAECPVSGGVPPSPPCFEPLNPPVGPSDPSDGPPRPLVGPPDPPVRPPAQCPRPAVSGLVHDSVRHLDNALEVYLCKKCPSYHCPLCPTEKVQFTASHEAMGHLQHHLTWAVVHGGFKVYKCHLSCNDKPHFHCHSCHKFIVRRCDYITHIKRHPCPAPQHPSAPAERPVSAGVPPSPPCIGPPRPPVRPSDPSDRPPSPPFGPPDASIVPPGPSVGPPGPCVGPPDQRPRHALSCLVAASVKLKVVHCPKCNLRLYAKNLRMHLTRRHTATTIAVTSANHLASQCVDGIHGVDTTALLKS